MLNTISSAGSFSIADDIETKWLNFSSIDSEKKNEKKIY